MNFQFYRSVDNSSLNTTALCCLHITLGFIFDEHLAALINCFYKLL